MIPPTPPTSTLLPDAHPCDSAEDLVQETVVKA